MLYNLIRKMENIISEPFPLRFYALPHVLQAVRPFLLLSQLKMSNTTGKTDLKSLRDSIIMDTSLWRDQVTSFPKLKVLQKINGMEIVSSDNLSTCNKL